MNDYSERSALLTFSARIGRDPTLVQASTGNVSIKTSDGVLWVKASGTWLADAEMPDFLIPVDLSAVRNGLFTGTLVFDEAGRRPSIETAMHVVLPYRIVVHVHSVNAIARVIRHGARAQLVALLQGLNWEWIPYAASGVPLACAIRTAMERSPQADVFLLENHGLVICAETTRDVEELLFQVERKLAVEPRQPPKADYPALLRLAARVGWKLPQDAYIHSLGTDRTSQELLGGGIIYPCQSLFWNGDLEGVFGAISPDAALRRIATIAENRTFLIVARCGVIVSPHLSAAEYEVLLGLTHVLQRVDRPTSVRYLTDGELIQLRTNGTHYQAQLERTGSVTA